MKKTALCDVRGLLVQLLDCLSGKDSEMWVEALKRFLRKENPWAGPVTALWQTPKQAAGGSCILRDLLDAAPEGEARPIDWYLEDTSRIPEEWEGKAVFFRNSEHRDANGNQVVRYLCWFGRRWHRGDSRVDGDVDAQDFVAVAASVP